MPALAPPIQAVLELFEGPLENVRFADIDASTLRRLAAEVEAASAQVESHEAALNALRQVLTERHDQLLVQAQRALAYARVYAENDDALSARLAAISGPRPTKRSKSEKIEKPEKTTETRRSEPGEMEEPTATRESASFEIATAPSIETEGASVPDSRDVDVAPAAATPARRGKRRDTTRIVALDDATAERT